MRIHQAFGLVVAVLFATVASIGTLAAQEKKDCTGPILSSAEVDGKVYATCVTEERDAKKLHELLKFSVGVLEKKYGKKPIQIQCFSDKAKAPDFAKTKGETPKDAKDVLFAGYDNVLVGEWRFCWGIRTDAGREGDYKKCVYDADAVTEETYKDQ